MSRTKMLEQKTDESRSRFAQIDPSASSYWEDYEKDPPSLLIRYDVEGLPELKEILSQWYSADLVKRLLVMAFHRREASGVFYSAEDLQNYTL